jgi:hypothetical protein
MHQRHLLPRIREACAQVLHGYLPRLKTARGSKAAIVPSALGELTAILAELRRRFEACMASAWSR